MLQHPETWYEKSPNGSRMQFFQSEFVDNFCTFSEPERNENKNCSWFANVAAVWVETERFQLFSGEELPSGYECVCVSAVIHVKD